MNVPYISVDFFLVLASHKSLKIFTDAFIKSNRFLFAIGQTRVYRLVSGKPEFPLQRNCNFPTEEDVPPQIN